MEAPFLMKGSKKSKQSETVFGILNTYLGQICKKQYLCHLSS